jgi:hypothetical protein
MILFQSFLLRLYIVYTSPAIQWHTFQLNPTSFAKVTKLRPRAFLDPSPVLSSILEMYLQSVKISSQAILEDKLRTTASRSWENFIISYLQANQDRHTHIRGSSSSSKNKHANATEGLDFRINAKTPTTPPEKFRRLERKLLYREGEQKEGTHTDSNT